jgi:hypothetical protein
MLSLSVSFVPPPCCSVLKTCLLALDRRQDPLSACLDRAPQRYVHLARHRAGSGPGGSASRSADYRHPNGNSSRDAVIGRVSNTECTKKQKSHRLHGKGFTTREARRILLCQIRSFFLLRVIRVTPLLWRSILPVSMSCITTGCTRPCDMCGDQCRCGGRARDSNVASGSSWPGPQAASADRNDCIGVPSQDR